VDEYQVWRTIDQQRTELADLLSELTPAQWRTQSLCQAWRVQDVAAHLTLAHMRPGTAAAALVLAGGRFDRMIDRTARAQARRVPTSAYPDLLRGMVGSRRRAPGVTPFEPMIDVLVHGQDIAVPLGIERLVPVEAAAAGALRIWSMGWPFHARRRFAGLRLVATDTAWSAGQGTPVTGPMRALLLLLAGRAAALPLLNADVTAQLPARLPARAASAPLTAPRPSPGRASPAVESGTQRRGRGGSHHHGRSS